MTASGDDVATAHSADATRLHVLRETTMMALYMAISLLAVLSVQPHEAPSVAGGLGLVWGTALGLTLAHWLAFHLAARVHSGRLLERHDRFALAGQAAASAGVAALASIPLLFADEERAFGLSRLLLGGVIGVFAYGVATRADASRLRAAVYAIGVTVIAVTVAAIKNRLTGH